MTQRPTNFVLWLVIALPLIAVAASLASLALAVNSGDTELPKDYHWEGAALDNDQQRLALAARERSGATISYQSDTLISTGRSQQVNEVDVLTSSNSLQLCAFLRWQIRDY